MIKSKDYFTTYPRVGSFSRGFNVKCPLCEKHIITSEVYNNIKKYRISAEKYIKYHSYECEALMEDRGYTFNKEYKIISKTTYELSEFSDFAKTPTDKSDENIKRYTLFKYNFYDRIELAHIEYKILEDKIYVKRKLIPIEELAESKDTRVDKEEDNIKEYTEILHSAIKNRFQNLEIIYED